MYGQVIQGRWFDTATRPTTQVQFAFALAPPELRPLLRDLADPANDTSNAI